MKFELIDKNCEQTEIDIIDGYKDGSYFWVVPVKIIDHSCYIVGKENVSEFQKGGISIDEEYLEEYLYTYLSKYFDKELEANRNRRSVRWIDDNDNKHYVILMGFEWYAAYNFYTFDAVKEMINDIKQVVSDLAEKRETDFTAKFHAKYHFTSEEMTYFVELDPVEQEKYLATRRYMDYSEDEFIIDFYNRFISRMENMLKIGQENGYDLISFTAY